jgi:hypothetical protein
MLYCIYSIAYSDGDQKKFARRKRGLWLRSPAKVIDLVAQYGIRACDGQFIALAMEMGIPCIIEDKELQKKFRGIALSMNDFLGPPTPESVRERKARYRAHDQS